MISCGGGGVNFRKQPRTSNKLYTALLTNRFLLFYQFPFSYKSKNEDADKLKKSTKK